MEITNELTFKNCKTFVLSMDKKQLDEMISTIKYRRNELNSELKNSFSIDDKVTFTGKNSKIVNGTVTKINRKRLVVREDDCEWMVWSIPPSMLTKLTEKGVDNG